MEDEKILEGQKEIDATSASDEVEPEVELNSTPVPTDEEKEDAGIPVSESDASETEPVEEKPELVEEFPAMKTFTQSQVNDMVGSTRTETREKTFRYIYDRYGVNNEEELDDLIGNAQRYDSLQEEYNGAKKEMALRDKELAEIKEQVALMQSGIDNGRYDDAKFILRGKGLEINLENINNELNTHPEWKKVEEPKKVFEPEKNTTVAPQAEPVSKLSVLGNEKVAPVKKDSEEDFAMERLFKL